MLGVRRPDLPTRHDPAGAIPARGGLDPARVTARVRLRDAEGQAEGARGNAGQDALAERRAPVLDDGQGWEHGEVDGGGAGQPGPRRADRLQHQAGLGHAEPGAAVGLRDGEPEPAGPGEGGDELRRVLALRVLLPPVLPAERPRQRPHLLADSLLGLGEREVHLGVHCKRPAPFDTGSRRP